MKPTVCFVTGLILLILIPAFGQESQVREFDSLSCLAKLVQYRDSFGSNKKSVPKQHELAILVALSHYPELSNTHITFKQRKIRTSMNARPTLGSVLFRKKSNYRFVVRINCSHQDSVIIIHHIPFNAQIGLFGHEFYHFIDYLKAEPFHVWKRMIDYTNEQRKEVYEKSIDRGTITRGLGWQLYDWSLYVQESNATERYKEFKRLIYLEPAEIKAILEE